MRSGLGSLHATVEILPASKIYFRNIKQMKEEPAKTREYHDSMVWCGAW